MTATRIGRALLALCGHRSAEADDLSDADWQTLRALADQHRLEPYLHARLTRGEIADVPGQIASGWKQAYRANGIATLGQRRALLQAVETLGASGIGAVALKGCALAWTVWPAPTERVMRDIDLLVAEENAADAYAALRAAGWDAPQLSAAQLRRFAREETHFPALFSPEGVMCELHAHVWGKPPLPGSPMPEPVDAHLLAHARYSEAVGAAIPAAQDMVAHLVVHSACSHLLNVGPLALVDIDLWCARKTVDWPVFWDRAEKQGFLRPAALVFALVNRWRRPGFLAASQCPLKVETSQLDEAELLLVQDIDRRKDVSAIASLRAGRLSGRAGQHPLDEAASSASPLARFTQVGARAMSVVKSALSKDTRRDGLATARLQKWMED